MSTLLKSTTDVSQDTKRALLAEQLRKAAEAPPGIPLSFAQQRLWFIDQLEPNSALYNVPTVLEISGALNSAGLQHALDAMVARHEVLRTRFVSNEGSPEQIADETISTPIAIHDLSALPEEQRATTAQSLIRAEVNRPFNLITGPLIRATLIRLRPDEHRLVLNLHHIVSDEWSLKICFQELGELYAAFCQARAPQLPELPIQYGDYTLWQRENLQGEVLQKQLSYWREQLAGNPPVLELPTDRPRPPVPTFAGSCAAHLMPKDLADALKQLSAKNDVTLFMTLLAAFKTLLHRYTQLEDILVGSPIAGRNQIETEPLIGFFVNTLVLRTSLAGNPTFKELLHRVRETTLGAYAHEDLPFEKIVEKLHPERTLSHMPFTRVMFVLQNDILEELHWPGLCLRVVEPESETAKFDLTFVVQTASSGMVIRTEFNRDLFDAGTIERLMRHFEVLLKGVVANPEAKLSELPLLTEAEQQQLLVEWNNTATQYPREKCVHELFEAQVERTPKAVAVTYGRQSITYQELNERANRLANHLMQKGVGPDTLVGLCVERSVDMIVGMVGILKAGGAYVPLDATYPKERLAFMLADAQVKLLITQQTLLTRVPKGTPVLCLDSDWGLIARESRVNPANLTTPENLAYVIYTSGSTGQPKGVAVTHRGITRLVLNTNYIQFTAEDRVGQISNASFDAATFEIWGALLNGAQLIGIAKDISLSPADFARELRHQKISAMFLTAALFNQLANEVPGVFSKIGTVMFGGEAGDPKSVRAVLRNNPPKRLVNGYGPTENTTFSVCHEVRELPEDATTVPIGKPISNSSACILDANLNLMPIGVPGELHVGGDGLARSYWNRPELTAQKFISNPFQAGERLYKTGDFARWRADGTIEFLGRIDNQVKIRGFRIELGEIETVLSQHPDVRECAVTVHQAGAQKRLVGYFVPKSCRVPSVSELSRFLKEKLPDYMVPAAFVQLDGLPLTPNGKVDRRALPEPDHNRPLLEKRYVQPRDEVEKKLTEIWESVLGVHPIGIEDKFFDLGGHSLLAVKLIAQIEKSFSRRLRLATIFQAPTIEQLAPIIREEIAEGSAIAGTSLVEIQSQGTKPPLFFIHGAGGGMFWGYVNLSRHLDDQPVYGLRSRGLDGRDEFNSIREMAAHYIEDIRAMQPDGPYYLGGYCFGGNVAFEVARQLKEQGEEVALLALFNSAPANSSYGKIQWTPAWAWRFVKNLFYWFNYYRQWTPPQRREFFRWKRESLKRRFTRWSRRESPVPGKVDAGDLVDLSSYSAEQRKLWEKHIQALADYHPQPFAGRVHLFRSPGHPLVCSFADDYGWEGFAKNGVDISIVPGVHEKILEEPCVQTLAEKMKTVLAEIRGEHQHESELFEQALHPIPENNGNFEWLTKWNDTRVEFPLEKTYAHHFEAQVARTPNATALRFQNSELTYNETNEWANRLAYYLQSLGVGPETLVAVCLERSLELPVALLAVLKAGGAYLPLDRSYPRERLNYMLADSGARVLVTTKDALVNLQLSDVKVICLDDAEQQKRIAACPVKNPFCRATADSLAYVIYTSGSTGQPKGVQITHRSLLNHNFAVARAYKLGPGDRVLQFSPVSFDISVEEIFPSLLSGCAVVLRTDEVLSSLSQFLRFVADEGLTVMNLPTAYWHQLVEQLQRTALPASVRLVVIGGEKALDEVWRRWKQSVSNAVTLINTYGPTETTVIATMHIAEPTDETLPIGKPIANMQTLILDAQLQPVAPGETGELHIGGIGLSRGYLNRPELTGKKFIENPFREVPSARLYKAGDLARYREDGTIEFVGRVDEQVKIRGFRVELGEIESALRAHPTIKDAVVVAREDTPGNKKLAAYFVPRGAAIPGVSELLGFLKERLPNYMMPSAFMRLDALPMTPAGKVDRRSLPEPGNARPELEQEYVAPRTPVEEVIAGIWSEVLGLNRVGALDNFFDLGGHSLLATQVISRIRDALQVEIPVTSLFQYSTVSALAEQITELSAESQPVLPVAAISKEEQLPLTPGQWRTWFLDLFEPGQSSYNIPTTIRLHGPLNLRALEQSLTELARRHDALRTVFPIEDGKSIQLICEPREVKLPLTDLRHLPAAQRETEARAIFAKEGAKPYVMSLPVLRTKLLRLSQREYWLLFMTHQVACDSRSVRLLFNELVALYDAFASGQAPSLPPLPMRYADAMASLQLPPEQEREQLVYWKRRMEGAPALLELPTDRPRPAHQSDAGARIDFSLGLELTRALDEFSAKQQCTRFELLLAAWQTLLSRYTGATDIVIGSSVPMRPVPELEQMAGKFDNLVPLRSDLSGDPSLQDFLARVRDANRGALAHSGLLFERLLSELKPERDASYSAIFQVVLDYYDEPMVACEAAGVHFTPNQIHNQTSKLDLKLHLERDGGQLSGWIEYSTALFDTDRIARMVEHFETLLNGALQNPRQQLSALPLLPEKETRQLIVEWNATEKEFPADATLAELFEAQVRRTPNAIALVAGSERLMYRELNVRANQVAHHLRSLGIGPGALVGICLERSWRLLVGILGVLKAGGAYVPLDPNYPKDRLAFIMEDTQAPVLLTQQSIRLPQLPSGTKVICLDSDWQSLRSNSAENPSASAASRDLAYIIYTSGSTGKPKGVALEHRNAVALVSWAKDVFAAEELKGVLASTSICFDLSVFEMFVPLSLGGTVILAENALALPGLPAAREVTLINTVPSAIRELLRIRGVPPSVQVVNLAGEPLVTPLVDRIYGETDVKKVYDLYGPSETTTYSTFTLRKAGEPATIGKPLANEQVYLLDKNRRPVPIGVPGEIYIGGAGVARGYLNRPELTAEKFVPNPFKAGGRLYKTGDLARWRADGNLEFLGRIDHQVKIRGFRIELGEVETALRKHEHVRESVVMAREDKNGDKRLVAYVVGKAPNSISVDSLRRFAKSSLPEYMVPSAFVVLDEMPLTPNGKVDRKALPEPDQERRETTETFVEPRTPVENELTAIWREVLGIERIGVRDNFFELGGHSLLAIQVISRVREKFKVELPLFSMFDAPTIEALGKGLASGEWTQNQLPVLPLTPMPRDGRLPVSFVQERLWFLQQLDPGDHAYNVPVALRLQGTLDESALQRAFDEIARRQEALRTEFVYADGELLQKITAPQPVKIQKAKFESAEARQKWINAEAQRPFDLAAGPLVRVSLASLNARDHVLLVVMHHTISDGWSLTILFQELEAYYNAFASGKTAPALPELTVQSADFAAWKRQCLQGSALETELAFWKEKLADAPSSLELPVDRTEPENANRKAERKTLHFPPKVAETISAFAHRENSTPFAVLMAALNIAFEKWTHQRDMVIGTVVAGRNRREMENVIGCFMNFLPIRTKLSGDLTAQELLAKVRSTVLEAQAHQDCPFEKIVEAVNPDRQQNKNPLYNVALLLQNFPPQMFKGNSLETEQVPVEMQAALLDLRFEAELNATGLSLACEFKTDLFDATTIDQFLASYKKILERLVENPLAKISDFKITPELETQARAARSRNAVQTLAIAGTFTAEPIEESLRYWMKELEIPAQINFAPFNQVFQELLDPASLLATNASGLNVVLVRLEDWLDADIPDSANSAEQLKRSAGEFVSALKGATARNSTPCLVIFCPASPPALADPRQKEIFEATEKMFLAELEKLSGVYAVGTRELAEFYPVAEYYDASGDELGAVPYLPVFFTALGTMIARKFNALKRPVAKVIVLDCDNTLWRGVCGEEGAKGICLDAPWKALQDFMRAQQNAGRLLAICSKNNEEDVREVFEQRLDMPLRHEHFAAWRTNWNPKSENIKSLAKELNLGLDSFIFVDDNPVECAEVQANCPEVLTLQLPENPEEIPQFLEHCWAFDVLKITAEDKRRGEMYRENRQREELMAQAMSLADFIAGLGLQIIIEPMTPEQLPRIAQLTHRTNQFNCTTIRRSETEIQTLAAANQKILTVSVKDRFGDYGLVGVMICSARGESLDVDSFLLSCRVLGRGVEHEILSHLGKIALEQKLHWVDVHFNPSSKNKPAHDFLESVGAEFKQPQNGGFIYRFPAEFAIEVTFNPPDEKVAPVEKQQSKIENKTTSAVNGIKPFTRCREIALQANNATVIQRAIEAKKVIRSAKQADYEAPATELETQLCTLWEKLLHVERVGVGDNFFDLGGHSLLAVRLFAEMEKATGRKLPLVTIFQASTIRELAKTLTEGSALDSGSLLVPVQPNGARPPLFLVHGAGGDVLWGYANLAKHLPGDQPIYGIKSRGRLGLPEFETIEEMANCYREEIQKLQPHGPYYLGGYCFGGNVAYEMARQLRARGEEVALLLMIDATPSNAGYEAIPWWNPKFPFRFARNFSHWLSDFSELPRDERYRFVARKTRAICRKIIGKLARRNGSVHVDIEEVIDPMHFPADELKFWQIHLRALITHFEKPYDGVITLLRTRGQQLLCSLEDDFCWGRLVSGVKVKIIPGSHENIFMEPHVKSLAQELQNCLSEAQSTSRNSEVTAV